MVSEPIEQLLILQDRDARCEHIQKQLAQIPLERAQIAADIEKERQAVAEVEVAVTALLAQNQRLEGDAEEVASKIVKYKTQQMQVKKNEVYKALEHEIDLLNARVSELEDEQLALLDLIDGKREQLQTVKEACAKEISLLEKRLAALSESEVENQGQLDDAVAAVEHARSKTGANALQTYDFVKGQVRRPPYVCPLEEGRCMGCRIRVSSDVDSQARRSSDTLARCDSCGRIVYRER